MSEKHLAIFRVSRDFLVETLHMPKDTYIYNVYIKPDVYSGDIFVVAEHPDLPAVMEGSQIQEISPSITSTRRWISGDDGAEEIIEYHWSWGVSENVQIVSGTI